MKNLLLLLLLLVLHNAYAQNVAINNDGSSPNAHAILDVSATDKGLLIPRMDSNARKAIPNTIGLLVYDSTTKSFWFNNGEAWHNLATGEGWSLGGNVGTDAGKHFIGTNDSQPLNFRTNGQAAGRLEMDQQTQRPEALRFTLIKMASEIRLQDMQRYPLPNLAVTTLP